MENNEMETVDFDPFAEGELLLTVPATEPQREVWVAAQMGGEASCAYNESVTIVIKGRVQLDLIKQAIQSLVGRHESLYATFSVDGATFCVGQPEELDLPIIDLSTAVSDEVELSVKNGVIAEVTQSFNLEHGPLFRSQIIKVSDSECRIILCAHHIICDGLSWGVLIPDFFAFYHALEQGQDVNLPVADRFSDFVHYHNEPEQKRVVTEAENYWLSQFSDQVPQLDFPTDRARPAKKTYRCDRIDYVVNPQYVAGLKKVGAGAGATFVVTLLAAFNTFLSRVSGQQDLVVGLMAASQSVSGFQHLVGHCVNLLPVRSQIEDEQSFVDYVKSLRGVMFDALDHQQVSFGSLLKKLKLPRELGRIPLCPITFNIDRAFTDVGALNLDVEVISNKRRFENFEIFLNAVESPNNGLVLECSYNLDLFDVSTIQRRLEEFEQLIASIVQEPQRPLSLLSLLPATEIKQLDDWNQTGHILSEELLIHQLIEEQVKVTPENIAVVFGDQQLSYVELDAKANQLANYLRDKGVRNGQVIGLAIARSEQLLVGMLAILKAGGVYLPLDPEYPAARLQYMLDDAKVSLLITQQALGQNFSDNLEKIQLDSDAEAIAEQSNLFEEHSVSEDASAYIIYTSGSTGKPKGVEVPHRCVVNFLNSMAKKPGLNSTDHLLAVTTLSFDIAVLELLLPLSVGAQTVIASQSIVRDGDLLLNALEQNEISVMQATPATWRMLLDAGWNGDTPIKVLCGGEPLPLELAKRLCSSSRSVWNMYGPTEATVWSSCSQISETDDLITVGKPIDNTSIYIVDKAMQRMPIGIPGELCIGGEGVVKGYVNRPGLTLERFVIYQGERLYRTGDLARYLNNGNIEHLGRIDNQVKVRGFRIELGEIESILAEASGVKQAVVAVKENQPGDVRLVAYLVMETGAIVDAEALREHCSDSLPAYMVPQHYMALDALPLTLNDKIDRLALPLPWDNVENQENYVAPQTDMEKKIATTWQEVLKQDQIGINDNFFNLGGHSLLATQIITRLRRELDVSLPMSLIFEYPSIKQIAAKLENSSPDELSGPPPVTRRNEHDLVSLSMGQQRLLFLQQLYPEASFFNLNAGFRLKGNFDQQAYELAINKFTQRHEILRSKIEWLNGVPSMVKLEENKTELAILDLQGFEREEREERLLQYIKELADQPFDFERGYAFRPGLVIMDKTEHVILVNSHPIFWDGWSFDIFLNDLAALYTASKNQSASSLAELSLQYPDFPIWHQNWMDKEGEASRQLDYWREQLRGSSSLLNLPRDRTRSKIPSYQGSREHLMLSKEKMDEIAAFAHDAGSTPYLVLLATFNALLYRYCEQDDLIMATQVQGRVRPEFENIIGPFVNTVLLRTRLDEPLIFIQLLQHVRKVCLEAFNHQDVSFDKVLEALGLEGGKNNVPPYQVMFTYQDTSNRPTTFADLDISQVNDKAKIAAYTDLIFWFKDTGRGLVSGLDYSKDLFDTDTIIQFLNNFNTLLESILKDPAIDISTVALKISQKQIKEQSLEDNGNVSAEDSTSNNQQHLTTDMQKVIASIWQEVLEIDHIDPYDNFFEIGGYSLLSMQVLEKIRVETGVHVPARAILMDSLAQIASYCEKGEDVDKESSATSTSKKLMAGLRKSFSFKK